MFPVCDLENSPEQDHSDTGLDNMESHATNGDATELCESKSWISKRDEQVVLRFGSTKPLSVSKDTLLKLHMTLKKKCSIGSFVTAAIFESFQQGDVIVKEIGIPGLADNLRRYYDCWDKNQFFENFEFIVPSNLNVEAALKFLEILKEFFLIPFCVHEERMVASRKEEKHDSHEKEIFFQDQEVSGWSTVRIILGSDNTRVREEIHNINEPAHPSLRFKSISMKWQVLRRQKVKSEVAYLGQELIATFSDAKFMRGREGLIVFFAGTKTVYNLRGEIEREGTAFLAPVIVQKLEALSIFSTSFGRGEMLRYFEPKLDPDLVMITWHIRKQSNGGYYTSEEDTYVTNMLDSAYSKGFNIKCPYVLMIRLKNSDDSKDPRFPKTITTDSTFYLQIVTMISISAAAWDVVRKIF